MNVFCCGLFVFVVLTRGADVLGSDVNVTVDESKNSSSESVASRREPVDQGGGSSTSSRDVHPPDGQEGGTTVTVNVNVFLEQLEQKLSDLVAKLQQMSSQLNTEWNRDAMLQMVLSADQSLSALRELSLRELPLSMKNRVEKLEHSVENVKTSVYHLLQNRDLEHHNFTGKIGNNRGSLEQLRNWVAELSSQVTTAQKSHASTEYLKQISKDVTFELKQLYIFVERIGWEDIPLEIQENIQSLNNSVNSFSNNLSMIVENERIFNQLKLKIESLQAEFDTYENSNAFAQNASLFHTMKQQISSILAELKGPNVPRDLISAADNLKNRILISQTNYLKRRETTYETMLEDFVSSSNSTNTTTNEKSEYEERFSRIKHILNGIEEKLKIQSSMTTLKQIEKDISRVLDESEELQGRNISKEFEIRQFQLKKRARGYKKLVAAILAYHERPETAGVDNSLISRLKIVKTTFNETFNVLHQQYEQLSNLFHFKPSLSVTLAIKNQTEEIIRHLNYLEGLQTATSLQRREIVEFLEETNYFLQNVSSVVANETEVRPKNKPNLVAKEKNFETLNKSEAINSNYDEPNENILHETSSNTLENDLTIKNKMEKVQNHLQEASVQLNYPLNISKLQDIHDTISSTLNELRILEGTHLSAGQRIETKELKQKGLEYILLILLSTLGKTDKTKTYVVNDNNNVYKQVLDDLDTHFEEIQKQINSIPNFSVGADYIKSLLIELRQLHQGKPPSQPFDEDSSKGENLTPTVQDPINREVNIINQSDSDEPNYVAKETDVVKLNKSGTENNNYDKPYESILYDNPRNTLGNDLIYKKKMENILNQLQEASVQLSYPMNTSRLQEIHDDISSILNELQTLEETHLSAKQRIKTREVERRGLEYLLQILLSTLGKTDKTKTYIINDNNNIYKQVLDDLDNHFEEIQKQIHSTPNFSVGADYINSLLIALRRLQKGNLPTKPLAEYSNKREHFTPTLQEDPISHEVNMINQPDIDEPNYVAKEIDFVKLNKSEAESNNYDKPYESILYDNPSNTLRNDLIYKKKMENVQNRLKEIGVQLNYPLNISRLQEIHDDISSALNKLSTLEETHISVKQRIETRGLKQRGLEYLLLILLSTLGKTDKTKTYVINDKNNIYKEVLDDLDTRFEEIHNQIHSIPNFSVGADYINNLLIELRRLKKGKRPTRPLNEDSNKTEHFKPTFSEEAISHEVSMINHTDVDDKETNHYENNHLANARIDQLWTFFLHLVDSVSFGIDTLYYVEYNTNIETILNELQHLKTLTGIPKELKKRIEDLEQEVEVFRTQVWNPEGVHQDYYPSYNRDHENAQFFETTSIGQEVEFLRNWLSIESSLPELLQINEELYRLTLKANTVSSNVPAHLQSQLAKWEKMIKSLLRDVELKITRIRELQKTADTVSTPRTNSSSIRGFYEKIDHFLNVLGKLEKHSKQNPLDQPVTNDLSRQIKNLVLELRSLNLQSDETSDLISRLLEQIVLCVENKISQATVNARVEETKEYREPSQNLETEVNINQLYQTLKYLSSEILNNRDSFSLVQRSKELHNVLLDLENLSALRLPRSIQTDIDYLLNMGEELKVILDYETSRETRVVGLPSQTGGNTKSGVNKVLEDLAEDLRNIKQKYFSSADQFGLVGLFDRTGDILVELLRLRREGLSFSLSQRVHQQLQTTTRFLKAVRERILVKVLQPIRNEIDSLLLQLRQNQAGISTDSARAEIDQIKQHFSSLSSHFHAPADTRGSLRIRNQIVCIVEQLIAIASQYLPEMYPQTAARLTRIVKSYL